MSEKIPIQDPELEEDIVGQDEGKYQDMTSDEIAAAYDQTKGDLDKAAGKRRKKGMFATLLTAGSILASTFGGNASAQEINKQVADDIQNQKMGATEMVDAQQNTIVPDPERDAAFNPLDRSSDFDANFEITDNGEVHMDALNSFPVDGDKLADPVAFESTVHKILSQITPENYDAFMQLNPIFEASADQRDTKYPGGNLGLSTNRAKAMVKGWNAGVHSFQGFAENGLTPNQAVDLINHFTVEPSDDNIKVPEGGVTTIADLIGEKDANELKTEAERAPYYKDARYARVVLELPADDAPNGVEGMVQIDFSGVEIYKINDYENLIRNNMDYDRNIIAMDVSGSMFNDIFSSIQEYTKHGGKILGTEIVPISDKAHMDQSFAILDTDDLKEAPARLLAIQGSQFEKQIAGIADKLETMRDASDGKTTGLLFFGDEGSKFNGADLERANKEAARAGVDVRIAMINSETKEATVVSLDLINQLYQAHPELHEKGQIYFDVREQSKGADRDLKLDINLLDEMEQASGGPALASTNS